MPKWPSWCNIWLAGLISLDSAFPLAILAGHVVDQQSELSTYHNEPCYYLFFLVIPEQDRILEGMSVPSLRHDKTGTYSHTNTSFPQSFEWKSRMLPPMNPLAWIPDYCLGDDGVGLLLPLLSRYSRAGWNPGGDIRTITRA